MPSLKWECRWLPMGLMNQSRPVVLVLKAFHCLNIVITDFVRPSIACLAESPFQCMLKVHEFLTLDLQ